MRSGPAWGRRAYPTSAMGTTALVRQTFLDAEWYAESLRLADAAPTAVARPLRDPVLDAVIAMKASGRPVAFAADTADEIHHALDRAAELGLRPIILGAADAWRVADFGGLRGNAHDPKAAATYGIALSSHYVLLGVTPQDDRDTIKKAYRHLARLYHPDLNKSAEAHGKMQEINQAYQAILGDVPEDK